MIRRLLLIALVIVVAVVAFEAVTFPDVSRLATEAPSTTAFMEIRRQQLRDEGKDPTILYTFVPYSRISPYLRRGVLVAEDNTFYEHEAVDTRAMKEAIERDWEHKRITHGGSTITQQLAKNLYLSPSRNPLRKIKEYFIARSLENHLTKKRILELYLNVVEMGERVYGAEAASRFYFHKSASELSPQQAALLAGCLPNPRVMNPGEPNKRLRARQRMILSRMKRWGYLFESEVLTAAKPVAAPPAPPAVDTSLQQTPPTDTATPAPTDTSSTEPPPAEAPKPETAKPETAKPETAPATTTDSTAPPTQTDTATQTQPPPA